MLAAMVGTAAFGEPSDCELTEASVAALIAASAPALRARSVRYLNQGMDSWVYAAENHAGRAWILRFPKRTEVAQALAREIALLPALAPRLPLAVPRFSLVGAPGPAYPHPFVGYPRVEGRLAIEALGEPVDPEVVGPALGVFLARLHAFPFAEARRLGIEREPEDPPVQAAEARRLLATYGTALSAAERARVMELLRPPAVSEEEVLCHTDFFPEHLLIDQGRAVGVIDWGDVSLGDPAVDLAGLFYWGAEPLLAAGLAAYGRERRLSAETTAELAVRARFFAVWRAATDLEYGACAGREEYPRMGLRALRGACG